MGGKSLLGCALPLSIASAFVLHPAQSLPEISTNAPTTLDASLNTSAYLIALIRPENFSPSISDPTSSLSLANVTAPAYNATLTEMAYECNGAPFPRPGPASYASCQNAFRNTPSGTAVRTIGDRAAGDFYMNLPQRFMSEDGLCVIDYDVARPGQMDLSSFSGLQFAAHATLGVCVDNLNRGGVATGLGQNSRLTVTVKQYLPRVHCTPSDKPPVAQMCEYVLLDMPTWKAPEVFGNRGTAGIDVPIPWTMATPGLECVIKVRMTSGIHGGPVIKTSWYRIWQEAVALTRLCANGGKTGESFLYNAGGEPRVTISIVNEARDSLAIGASDDVSQVKIR